MLCSVVLFCIFIYLSIYLSILSYHQVCTLWRSRVASEALALVTDTNKPLALAPDTNKPLALVPDTNKPLARVTEAEAIDRKEEGHLDCGIEMTSTGSNGSGNSSGNGTGTGSGIVTSNGSSSGNNGSGAGTIDDTSNGHVVQPTLSIVFADNYVMTVTQRAMVRQMVKMGMGAPSGNDNNEHSDSKHPLDRKITSCLIGQNIVTHLIFYH